MIASQPSLCLTLQDTGDRKINEVSLWNLRLALCIDNLEMHYLQNRPLSVLLYSLLELIT